MDTNEEEGNGNGDGLSIISTEIDGGSWNGIGTIVRIKN